MKPRPKIITRILDAIHDAQTLCVAGHVRPDGDCIGSQLALALALRAGGKQVTVWNEDRSPDKLRFLDPLHLLQQPVLGMKFDLVVTTDVASEERLGRVADCIRDRGLLVNIDHHASNTRFGDINWIGAREPSTGELIFQLLKSAGWPITPQIASCLFTAISTDTGSFQYPSTRPSTFATAGELVKRGADLGHICHAVYHSYPLSRVRLLRHVFTHFRLTHRDQIAYFWLKPVDFAHSGADRADAEGLIDHIRAIEPVVVACVFEEAEPGVVRISLRSKSDRINVSEIAAQFGGGGHPAAAGARVVGNPLGVQRRVIAALRKALTPAPAS